MVVAVLGLVAVRSLRRHYLAPSVTSSLLGRIRRKIVTLCCFLLLLVVIIVVTCPHCRCRRCRCCWRLPHPLRSPCRSRPPLLCCHKRDWWWFIVLLLSAVLDILVSRWLTLSLLGLVRILPPSSLGMIIVYEEEEDSNAMPLSSSSFLSASLLLSSPCRC